MVKEVVRLGGVDNASAIVFNMARYETHAKSQGCLEAGGGGIFYYIPRDYYSASFSLGLISFLPKNDVPW